MSRSLPTLALALAVTAAVARADVLTVDNSPGSVAMFTSAAAAHDAASDGDTILVAGSSSNYGSVDVYKRLTFIGSGYFLGQAPSENDIPGLVRESTSLGLRFRSDPLVGSSSGSRAVGISGRIWSDAGVNDLLVDRCRLLSSSTFEGETVVQRCYARSAFVRIGEGSLVTNSIVDSLSLELGAAADHCLIDNPLTLSEGASISNSIFLASSTTPLTGSISHCLAVGNSILPEGAGNINDQTFLDVFLNSTSNDGRFQLRAGSPALGAGIAGSDIGVFGGATPYVLSGVPGVPRITRLVVPATATSASGLQFEVDARSFPE